MDTTALIKRFVILEISLSISYLALSFYLESKLPELLQDYLAYQPESESNATDLIALLGGIPVLLIYIVAIIGLLRTRIWAKNLYIFVTVASYLLTPFLGATVEHAISAAVYDLGTLNGGIILALLIFTKSSFNKSSQQDALTHSSA